MSFGIWAGENEHKGKDGWAGHVMKDIGNAAKSSVIDGELAVQFDSVGDNQLVTDKEEITAWMKKWI